MSLSVSPVRAPRRSSFGRRLAVFALRRILIIPLSLLIVVTVAFGLVALMPGDPAAEILGQFATPAETERIRRELGLDKPLPVRYVDYIAAVARGDLGTSFFSGRGIAAEIATYLPNTIELIVLSLGLATGLGLLVGTIGAYFRGQLPDRIGRVLITAFQSIPDFLLGLVLIFILFYLWRVVPPPVGRLSLVDARPVPITNFLLVDTLLRGDIALFASALKHAFLPVLTLGLVYSAYLAKTARATMAASLTSAQVEFARACGLPERQVLWYAFTTAMPPILTYGAILFGALVGGAAIVEIVFSWQGLGSWALTAILKRDVPAIQGFIIVAGLATLLVYLVLDLVVMVIDPRIRVD